MVCSLRLVTVASILGAFGVPRAVMPGEAL
jgi:hypothetical protein